MLNIELDVLVRDALLASGCDESVISDFDKHSTIALHFNELPSMFISEDDGDVWLWTRLCEQNDSVVMQGASRLLTELMNGCKFCRTGQLQLDNNDGFFELKGMLNENYLHSHEMMAEALDEFYTEIETFMGILK